MQNRCLNLSLYESPSLFSDPKEEPTYEDSPPTPTSYVQSKGSIRTGWTMSLRFSKLDAAGSNVKQLTDGNVEAFCAHNSS